LLRMRQASSLGHSPLRFTSHVSLARALFCHQIHCKRKVRNEALQRALLVGFERSSQNWYQNLLTDYRSDLCIIGYIIGNPRS
jgi:hypothetical protein